MYLKRLKLKNYRLFSEADISFHRGMNVLIGKNSSGKSSILEAIDFLLSTNNANVSAEDIIPYAMRSHETIQVRIDGYFEMSELEKESLCTTLDNPEDREKIRKSHLELIYTKSIYKKDKIIRVEPKLQTNGNGISHNQKLMHNIFNSFWFKLQTNNVIKMTDVENNSGIQKLRPNNELLMEISHQTFVLYQYLRNKLYEMKLGDIEKFNKIQNEIKKAYPETPDMGMDIEFDPNQAQLQIYFNTPGSEIKMPLENEGTGIREFFYLFLTLHYFPDTVILKDEALTHLHKSLLRDFLLAIEGLQFQMITTSHIKELIQVLDFSNIIICKKTDGISIAKNMMQIEEINTVLNDLGYSIEPDAELAAIIQEMS
ncbi:MAG: AAA family ATPase [Treponema sp.]|jgi:predicted ATP-dependent endonuclease of OLD family|nr:AAA family ATPase [Treponema sp.]